MLDIALAIALLVLSSASKLTTWAIPVSESTASRTRSALSLAASFKMSSFCSGVSVFQRSMIAVARSPDERKSVFFIKSSLTAAGIALYCSSNVLLSRTAFIPWLLPTTNSFSCGVKLSHLPTSTSACPIVILALVSRFACLRINCIFSQPFSAWSALVTSSCALVLTCPVLGSNTNPFQMLLASLVSCDIFCTLLATIPDERPTMSANWSALAIILS